MELEGKVAIVTGGSRGIGRAIALELGRAGATVIVNYHSNAAAAEQVVAELGRGQAIQADVGTTEGAERLVAAAVELGGLDILVNNAGITADNLMLRMTDEQWQSVMDTNAGGCFRMCRAGVQAMFKARNGGSIINIVSIAGIRGNAGQSNYSASKAAIIGLTRTLAKEMGSRKIRVNAVAPGFVETDMVADVDERVIDGAKKLIPMRRLGKPEDIAPLVLFLASPGSAYLTGQVIAVDGGMSV